MLLQSGASVTTKQEAFCFTKRGKWYYKVGYDYRMAQFLLQNREGDIAKWDNHYKKGKYGTKRF